MSQTRCAGSDVLADSPVCPGCGKEHDRYRDNIAGRIVFRFVEHSAEVAEPPAELIHALIVAEAKATEEAIFGRDEPETPDLERILVGVLCDLSTVASWLGTLTDARDLHAVQYQLANVTLKAEELETTALRLRMEAA